MPKEKLAKIESDVKMVRGVLEYDGKRYQRWVPAYKDGTSWYMFDSAKRVDNVDCVLEMSQLDDLAA